MIKKKNIGKLLKAWKNVFISVIFGPQDQLFAFSLFLLGKIHSVLDTFNVCTSIWNKLSLTTCITVSYLKVTLTQIKQKCFIILFRIFFRTVEVHLLPIKPILKNISSPFIFTIHSEIKETRFSTSSLTIKIPVYKKF